MQPSDVKRFVPAVIPLDGLLWKDAHLPDAALGTPCSLSSRRTERRRGRLAKQQPPTERTGPVRVHACPPLPDSIQSSVQGAGVPVARIWNRHLIEHVGVLLCHHHATHPSYFSSGAFVRVLSYNALAPLLDTHLALGEQRTLTNLLSVLTAYPRTPGPHLQKMSMAWPIGPYEPSDASAVSELAAKAFRSATMSELGALFSGSTLLFFTSNTCRGVASVFVCKHLNAHGEAPLGGFSLAMTLVAAAMHEAHCRAAVGEAGDAVLYEIVLDNSVVRLEHGHLATVVERAKRNKV